MAKLVAYGQIGGQSLTKAMCEICGKKFGSLEEAQRCETNHFIIKDAFKIEVNKNRM